MKEMTHVRNCAAMLHTGVSSFLFALPPSLAPSLPPPLSLSLALSLRGYKDFVNIDDPIERPERSCRGIVS
jgi:hypothetical protein